MSNVVLGKTMQNVSKHRYNRLVITDKRRSYLVSQPKSRTTKLFSENLLAIEMNKTKLKMNKPIYLGMSIFETSKTVTNEFWDDYVKPKYQDKAQLCYVDTDSVIVYIKIKDVYKDIAGDV